MADEEVRRELPPRPSIRPFLEPDWPPQSDTDED